MPRVLVACEMSGRVRTQFALRGWDAWSADLLDDESPMWCGTTAGQHYKGDVLDIIGEDWDLVIAHPPCTHLSQAGARYWAAKQADGRQREAVAFFLKLFGKPRPEAYVVVENPVGFMGIKDGIFREPDQVVQPSWFGDPLKKATCLWYRGAQSSHPFPHYDQLPLLTADRPVEPTGRVATGGGSWRTDKARGKTGMNRNWEDSQGRARRHILRSITPEGFARAAAEQWGGYIEGLAALYTGQDTSLPS